MSSRYSSNSSSSSSAGIGFSGLLTVAFVVLKLCHVIDWPWIWVLSPVWISFVLAVIVVAIYIGITVWIKKL